MSTGTMCLLVSVGVLILAMIYLDIVDERPRSRAAHRRGRPAPAPAVMDAQYFTMPDGERVRRR